MPVYDRKWEELVKGEGINLELYVRYMDDGRIFCHALKRGWRWVEGGMRFCDKWAREDQDRTLLDISVEVMKESMKGVKEYLPFTVETGADYGDGWLPTLDASLFVEEDNTILYRYYAKPTTTNTTIRRMTAMAENAKMQSLSNDLVRRLLNCKEGLPASYREEETTDQWV